MHYPKCKTLPVRTRNCRLLQRHARDVTLTRAGTTDITLSRMTLAPTAIFCKGFGTRSRQKRPKSSNYCGSIHILRYLPDQGGDVCKVWFRLVQKCDLYKVQTNKLSALYIRCCRSYWSYGFVSIVSWLEYGMNSVIWYPRVL
jgi:hypothetical protein